MTLETVSEAQADEPTRAVFEDIKSTMGVALVNLVWRRLALTPSVLHWSWQTLKPHYQNSAIPASAWLLREQMELPTVDQFTTMELDGVKHELKDADVIDDILRTYERGNALNLIALCHLRYCLNVGNRSDENPVLRIGQTSAVQLNPGQKGKEQEDTRFGEIPDLPQLQSLPDDIQSLIGRASELWVTTKYPGLTPSVFRHLSYWPDLATLFASRLETIERNENPNIGSTAVQALQRANDHASKLGNSNNELPELGKADHQWLQEVLEMFIEGILARGVIIVPTLRSLLAKHQQNRELL